MATIINGNRVPVRFAGFEGMGAIDIPEEGPKRLVIQATPRQLRGVTEIEIDGKMASVIGTPTRNLFVRVLTDVLFEEV